MLKGKSPLVVAGILALLATGLAYKTIKYKEDVATQGWNLVQVVVAGRNLPEGTVIEFDMIKQWEIPEKFLTPSVIRPSKVQDIIGQRLLIQLQPGDLISWNQFQSESAQKQLSRIVPIKHRAVTVNLGESAALGGLVQPSDHVDILGTFHDPRVDGQVTLTLLQNVLVLATGTTVGASGMQGIDITERRFTQVTLDVLPEEAEILVLAGQLGGLHFSLRNPDDISTLEERSKTTLDTLLVGDRIEKIGVKRKGIIVIRLERNE